MCWTFHVDGLFGATPELLVRRERGPGHLAGAGRHDPAYRRRRARPGAGRHAGPVVEGPRGARVRRPLGRRLARAALLVDERARGAVRPAPAQRHAPGHRRRRRRPRRGDASSSLELAAALHPSAAVGGTPTTVATDLIAEIEGMDRGRYAGPVGWMDAAGDGEWGIALRSAAGRRRHGPAVRRLRHRRRLRPRGRAGRGAGEVRPRAGRPQRAGRTSGQDADMERFDLSDPTFDVTSSGCTPRARRAGTSRPTGAGRCCGTPRRARCSGTVGSVRATPAGRRRTASTPGCSPTGGRRRCSASRATTTRRIRRLLMPGVPQQGDRRDAPALPGARERAHRRVRGPRARSSSSASSRSRTPPGSSACCSGCPRTTGPRSRTGPTTSASRSASASADDLPRDRGGPRRAARLHRRGGRGPRARTRATTW